MLGLGGVSTFSVFFRSMDSLFGGTPEQQARIRAGEDNMAKYSDKVSKAGAAKSGAADSPGLLGPSYSYADELPAPNEIGVRDGGDVGAIMDSAAGVNYYVDAIGFGQKTMFNTHDLNPLGLRYFMSTGATCSNGALMWDYIDTTPQGNLLGKRVDASLQSMGLPRMRGLAPGILEDARDALNPMPIFNAAMGTGYPKCKQVTMEVGDMNGRIASAYDSSNVWIKGAVDTSSGRPRQTRWIQDRDSRGNPLFMSRVDFENDTKKFYPDGSPIEGFGSRYIWEKYIDRKTAAGLLLAGIAVGLATFAANKE